MSVATRSALVHSILVHHSSITDMYLFTNNFTEVTQCDDLFPSLPCGIFPRTRISHGVCLLQPLHRALKHHHLPTYTSSGLGRCTLARIYDIVSLCDGLGFSLYLAGQIHVIHDLAQSTVYPTLSVHYFPERHYSTRDVQAIGDRYI
jgi:hypothetical protein